MFRENETRYLIASAALVWGLTGLLGWYEIGYNGKDSLLDAIVAIAQGVSTAVAVTIATLASIEVVMIFAERYRQRRFKEGRQEGIEIGRLEGTDEERRAWEAWNERRLQAEANGEPFNEPPPSQRHSNPDSNGKNS